MRDQFKGCVLLSAFVLSGCASAPGIWPLSERPSLPPGYPSVKAVMCKGGVANVASPAAGNDDLYCVQQDAVVTLSTFSNEQRVLEAINNGEVLALLGLGIAGGVETVSTKSAEPVKEIGLAAISLLGLSTGLGLSGQRTAYEVGAVSVACLIQVDAALDEAEAGVAPPEEGAGGPSGLSFFDARLEITNAILRASPGPGGDIDSPDTVLSSGGAALALDALSHAQEAQDEDAQLQVEVKRATDSTQRAATLSTALSQIKRAVADQLYKNADVTKIYDTAKQGYQSLVKNIPSAQASTQKAASSATTSGGLALASAVGNAMAPGGAARADSVASGAVGKVQEVVKQAQSDASAAQKVTETYDSCVGKASPQPPSQTKPPTKSTG